MKRTARLIRFTTVILAVLMILDTLFMPVFTRRERLVIDAMSHLGVRYSWGQKGPDYFDCSGLMVHCYGQFGIEAQIPVNRASGNHVGVLLDAHLYFDDLFPGSLGKPLF